MSTVLKIEHHLFTMRSTTFFIAAISACLAIAAKPPAKTTFPDPLPIKGPFFFVHDPSLVQRQDGKYFLFTTHDKAGIITATHLEGYGSFFSSTRRLIDPLQPLDGGWFDTSE
jgi:hypothetical protein